MMQEHTERHSTQQHSKWHKHSLRRFSLLLQKDSEAGIRGARRTTCWVQVNIAASGQILVPLRRKEVAECQPQTDSSL